MICYYCNKEIIKLSCQQCSTNYVIVTDYNDSYVGIIDIEISKTTIVTTYLSSYNFGICIFRSKDIFIDNYMYIHLPEFFTLTHSLQQIKEKVNLYVLFS